MPDDRRGSGPLNPWQMWQAWLSMFGIRAPLSGDVTQDISPSFGLVNINATSSGNPELEKRIVTQVAGYGRQLGKLVEAVDVLVRQQSRQGLDEADIDALEQLHKLAERIAEVKEEATLDQVNRIVSDVRALSRDPEANAEAIQRVREALPER
ncbi:MAG: hypothetical protein ACRDRI_16955 [Pseudonocardiaceae bacterium]